jgi:hypothetical protein
VRISAARGISAREVEVLEAFVRLFDSGGRATSGGLAVALGLATKTAGQWLRIFEVRGYVVRSGLVRQSGAGLFAPAPDGLERARAALSRREARNPIVRIVATAKELIDEGEYPGVEVLSRRAGVARGTTVQIVSGLRAIGAFPATRGLSRTTKNEIRRRVEAARRIHQVNR